MGSVSIALVSFKFPPRYSGYGNQLHAVTRRMATIAEGSLRFTVLTAAHAHAEVPSGITALVRLVPRFASRLGNWIEFYWFVAAVAVWLTFAHRRYQLIHCVKAGPESTICVLVGRIFGKPVIVKVAQDEIRGAWRQDTAWLKRLLRRRRVRALRQAHAVIAISDQIRAELLRSGISEQRIHSLPNGVDAERFRPVESTAELLQLRRELGLHEHAVVGLFVGSLSVRKGVADLLDALRMLKTNRASQFVLCGPEYELGPQVREECARRNEAAAGRTADLSYAGNVADVEKYMRAADFLLLPSYSEGLPNVLLEASLTGLPVICTDIGGNRDIVDAIGNGVLVPVGNVRALSDAVLQMIEDDRVRERLRNSALEQAARRYSLDRVATKYCALYADLLA